MDHPLFAPANHKKHEQMLRNAVNQAWPVTDPQLKSQYQIQDLASIFPESIRNLISYTLLSQVGESWDLSF